MSKITAKDLVDIFEDVFTVSSLLFNEDLQLVEKIIKNRISISMKEKELHDLMAENNDMLQSLHKKIGENDTIVKNTKHLLSRFQVDNIKDVLIRNHFTRYPQLYSSKIEIWEEFFDIKLNFVLDVLVQQGILKKYSNDDCPLCEVGGHVIDGMCMDCGTPIPTSKKIVYKKGNKFDTW